MGAQESEPSQTPYSGSRANYFQIYNRNFSLVLGKLLRLKSVSVEDGVDAMRMGRVALLSDYTTIYPYIRKTYDNDDICKLVSIHLATKIKKYFFAKKNFKYKELFKIGMLRIKESGILNRIVSTEFEEPKCTKSHLIQIRMSHISIPVTILVCTYVVSLLILVAERIYFKRNVVWPYVD
ncbi:hypothetical protein PYW07_012127 [Mythimna separata]|uniref:Uncharacterized protein n=1 Tax=Mythimna separata TaxID=271217 RepID=A0AAD7YM68_MYTSE|nr:hypothetical protein PYW07_012127 [Mythimna separata]